MEALLNLPTRDVSNFSKYRRSDDEDKQPLTLHRQAVSGAGICCRLQCEMVLMPIQTALSRCAGGAGTSKIPATHLFEQ